MTLHTARPANYCTLREALEDWLWSVRDEDELAIATHVNLFGLQEFALATMLWDV